MSKHKESRILQSVHESVAGLHAIGIVDAGTMREFDALCLPKLPIFDAKKIKKLRKREHLSQSGLAAFLNVHLSTIKNWETGLNVHLSTIKNWETGQTQPMGAALRLLDILDQHGVDIVLHAH